MNLTIIVVVILNKNTVETVNTSQKSISSPETMQIWTIYSA